MTEPFEWWHSGQFWYCSLRESSKYKVSGCGLTKEEAVEDARRELLIREGRRLQRSSVS